LTLNTRDYDAGFRRAASARDRFVNDTNRAFAQIGGGAGGRGGLLPGLSNIANIIQAIPQIGNLAGALINPLRHATEEGIRFNMMIESAEAGFVGVARGIEGARKHVEALRKFGEDSPLFETDGLVRTSRLMNVFGFQLSEHIPKIKVWGDAIAAQGEMSEETLLGVARAFGQMRAIGRVNAEEMNQLAERGIPAWELLARAIGKTVSETRKLGEQGRLNGPAAVEAITAMISQDPRFKGTAERQAGTLAGRLARLEEIRGRAQGLATEGLTRDISGALEAGLQGEDVAMRMAGSINAAIAPVSGMVKAAVVGSIGGGITTGIQEGIEAGRGAVSATMQTFALGSVLGPFKAALGIESPSKEFMYLGEMAAEGFHIGFANGMKKNLRFADEIEEAIAEAARATGLDPNLIRAVIQQESGGRRRAVSSMGAQGLMQLMPGTARQMGVTDPFDVRQNVMGGSKYLAGMLAEFRDLRLALAAYNAGPGAVRAFLPNRPDVNSYVGGSGRRFTVSEEAAQRAQGMPQNNQTPGYVRNIMAMFQGGAAGGSGAVPVRVVNDEYEAAKRDLAASTNWRTRNGGVDLGRLSHDQQLAALMQVPGFREQYERHMAPYRTGHLTGGYGEFADDPRNMGLAADLPFRPGINAAQFLQPASTTSLFSGTGLGSAAEGQFNLLAALGQIGPTIEEGFQQGEAAAGSFYASVVRQTGDARALFGITAKDMKGLFEDSFVSSFTRTDLTFKGMVGNMALTFAQGVNQMVQTWAASQLSSLLGKVIGAVAGSIAGGIGGGGKVSAVGIIPGRYSGGPVEAGKVYETHGLNRREFFVPEMDGRIVTGKQGGPTQVTNIKNINITLPPPRPADNARTRVSQREAMENLLGLLR
jgi:tape measure domain-containing protein